MMTAQPRPSGGGGAGGVRYDIAQALTGPQQIQGLENLGLTFKANGDAITVDPDIQADTEIPLQATTP